MLTKYATYHLKYFSKLIKWYYLMDNPLHKYRQSASFWMVKFRIQLLKIEFFQITSKFMKKCGIFFRKNGILSRRSKICSPKFFQTIFRLFATFSAHKTQNLWTFHKQTKTSNTSNSSFILIDEYAKYYYSKFLIFQFNRPLKTANYSSLSFSWGGY